MALTSSLFRCPSSDTSERLFSKAIAIERRSNTAETVADMCEKKTAVRTEQRDMQGEVIIMASIIKGRKLSVLENERII